MGIGITWNGDELHAALCSALGIANVRGSRQKVAHALQRKTGTSRPDPQWYGKVLAGEGALDQVAVWCGVSGVGVVVADGHARFTPAALYGVGLPMASFGDGERLELAGWKGGNDGLPLQLTVAYHDREGGLTHRSYVPVPQVADVDSAGMEAVGVSSG